MLKCLGFVAHSMDGDDYDCEYENATFSCEDCIINGGRYSPQTGKLFRGNPAPYIEDAKRRREKRKCVSVDVSHLFERIGK